MSQRLLGLLIASCTALCSGCVTVPPDGPAATRPRGIFEDVPVMSGMNYDPGKSFIYETKGRRVCALEYAGRVEFLAAVRYYKEQMQADKWTYVSIIGSDPITLEFTKPGERARLVVQSKGPGRTALTIHIGEDESSVETGDSKVR
jgi:hypothetical protein